MRRTGEHDGHGLINRTLNRCTFKFEEASGSGSGFQRGVVSQVSTTVPSQINALLDGVPTIVHVKGLDLNTSLARSPKVTPDRLILWDWGRFQNPNHKLQVTFRPIQFLMPWTSSLSYVSLMQKLHTIQQTVGTKACMNKKW